MDCDVLIVGDGGHPRSLEIFEALGIVEDLLAAGAPPRRSA